MGLFRSPLVKAKGDRQGQTVCAKGGDGERGWLLGDSANLTGAGEVSCPYRVLHAITSFLTGDVFLEGMRWPRAVTQDLHHPPVVPTTAAPGHPMPAPAPGAPLAASWSFQPNPIGQGKARGQQTMGVLMQKGCKGPGDRSSGRCPLATGCPER